MTFLDKKVVVMGLGLFDGGVAVTRYLIEHGAQVLVTDLRCPEQLQESLAALENLPVRWRLGEHCDRDFIEAEVVIVNPGVPETSAYLQLARSRNITIDTEVNLFLRQCPAPVIGVTGSNGKSTTSAMIAHILKAAGYRIWLGGNIGRSLLPYLSEIKAQDRVVLELSSFQLQRLAGISPPIAVVTNLTPNHLDRHGTLENYGKAKQNILKFQNLRNYCILNSRDPLVSKWGQFTPAQKFFFNGGDIEIIDAAICRQSDSGATPIIAVADLPLSGRAYQENAMAAIAAACTQGVATSTIAAALPNFQGLPHRLQFLGTLARRKVYEDSDATTPESTITALDALSGPIVLIAGGGAKGFDYNRLAEVIRDKVKTLILMGETAPAITQAVIATGASLSIVQAGDMEDAVRQARQLSAPGDSVILSPASTSFGMFLNYVQRGKVFQRLVTSYFQ